MNPLGASPGPAVPISAQGQGLAGVGGRRRRMWGDGGGWETRRVRSPDRAEGEGARCPADLSDDGWFPHRRWLRWLGREGGRHGQRWRPAASVTLPFFSLICPRRPTSSPSGAAPGCRSGRGAGGRTGDHRTLEQLLPRDLARHLLPARGAEPGEVKQPQKIQSIFNAIFSFFFSYFQPLWDLALGGEHQVLPLVALPLGRSSVLPWDRRIREKHEVSCKVFACEDEEGRKTTQ